MTIVETREDSAKGPSRRRKLSLDDERAIAKLYAETRTPTAEIRERFGIGESSLYRVVQRHGVALRGRTGPSSPSKPGKPVATRTRRQASPAAKPAAAPTSPASTSTSTSTPSPATGQQRFRIRFEAESVFEATDMRDALRQAESLGATEITAVARLN